MVSRTCIEAHYRGIVSVQLVVISPAGNLEKPKRSPHDAQHDYIHINRQDSLPRYRRKDKKASDNLIENQRLVLEPHGHMSNF